MAKVEPRVQISVCDFDPQVFAEQLTVFQHMQFQKVKETELLQQRYSKGSALAPNIAAITAQFNPKALCSVR